MPKPKYIRYRIKEKLLNSPEIELPEGSQVIRIQPSHYIDEKSLEPAESWHIIWLEPKL